MQFADPVIDFAPAEPRLYGITDRFFIPAHLVKQFYSLTFRWKTPMKRALKSILTGEHKGWIVWAERDRKVLAWGLLIWKDPASPEIMLYTRRAAQGGGLASKVFWALRHKLGGPGASYTYYPHDEASSAFYMRQQVRRAEGTELYPTCTWLTD